eukprot:1140136-Pelagomonas_calceolata.AAC.1
MDPNQVHIMPPAHVLRPAHSKWTGGFSNYQRLRTSCPWPSDNVVMSDFVGVALGEHAGKGHLLGRAHKEAPMPAYPCCKLAPPSLAQSRGRIFADIFHFIFACTARLILLVGTSI